MPAALQAEQTQSRSFGTTPALPGDGEPSHPAPERCACLANKVQAYYY